MTRNTHSDQLIRLGWNTALADALAQLPAASGRPVRVVEQHRSGYRVHDGQQEFSARTQTALYKTLDADDDGIAVGDWALFEEEGESLTQLIPRTSLLERTREDGRRQRLVANVDTALLVMGLDGDFSADRLMRYRLMAIAAGAAPVLLLTKIDRVRNADALRAEVQALAGDATPVLTMDARSPQATAMLASWLLPGRTLVLLGSSGVGKSTLMNNLLGNEGQRTGATQSHDDLGRHTTTARSLRMLPSGACLIDTPGLRELKLSQEQAQVEDEFAEIRELARHCRFSDCGHRDEPGCAVIRDLSAARIAEWRASMAPRAKKFRRGKP
ncbi:ribosome small subunit-dependent GTPase A [Hydrocarboniphaga sp.]|uniref:ribosome small subunit-dependent GTPase A n=1 Tax=Hydrocarboniphaga sp. TaxID=2033016 RepID=UPI003D10E52C